jgi:Na+-driven multidrug efflux pump
VTCPYSRTAADSITIVPVTWLLGVYAGLGVVGGGIGLALEIVIGAALFWLHVYRGGPGSDGQKLARRTMGVRIAP